MPLDELSLDALRQVILGTTADRPWSPPAPVPTLVVDLDAHAPVGPVPAVHAGVAAVVVGVTSSGPAPDDPAADDPAVDHPAAVACDLVLRTGDPALHAVAATVDACPLAACSLVGLLRGAEHRSLDAGLTAESAVYSTLQAGPEFAAWRRSRPARSRPPGGDAVTLARRGPALEVTLDRPHVRNALDTRMRDQLVDAFALVAADDTIAEVHLRGAGAAFCAGGDLDEFGTFPDPATAHLVRLRQSVGRAIAAVGDRVTAHLHGAAIGSGIELPAFAGIVVADEGTTIALPEVSLGLVPGAGGTVSIPRRIGRHRTARLALAGEHIDAATALDWGLVDRVEHA
ncbi:MAG: enoyl-CoA hydratase/isomerase family protein [Acidimicrobiales bacterium]|nr:enoyl-CoA hydratase/isomerase family protein [Acidimicrobiales bacterium]